MGVLAIRQRQYYIFLNIGDSDALAITSNEITVRTYDYYQARILTAKNVHRTITETAMNKYVRRMYVPVH